MEKKLRSIHRIRLRQVCDGRVRFEVDRVSRPSEVYAAIRPFYRGADREILSVLCLDAQNQPTSFNIVSIGSLNTTRTRPAELVKAAILSNALGLVLIHNHPSGCLEASPEDIEFTRSVNRACELLGLEMFDHLIVSDDGFMSFREQGLL